MNRRIAIRTDAEDIRNNNKINMRKSKKTWYFF